MRKITICFMVTCLSFTFLPFQSNASTKVEYSITDISKPPSTTEVNAAMQRLHEIKNMDKSNLTSSEKKVLRKEVRSIRNQLSHAGRGLYISLGAAIIIVLLLILIL